MNVDLNKLERAFSPKCLAIIGDKKMSNYMWLRSHLRFPGKLYSVQVDPNEIPGIEELGITNYTSLMDIPEPVDLAIVAVPRAVAPRILADLIQKDVAAAHFFTAGFSETDTDEGRELERVLVNMAEKGNFHIVGPNCMGVFNPSMGIGQGMMMQEELPEAGPIGFISQSGTHAVTFNRQVTQHGLAVNKTVSFGNGIVLDSPDYLEFFGQDDGIKVIGMYIEGVKDGKRFLKVLKEVTAKKPVVIWKGGRTEEGDRAIASHTGSLAVSHEVWNAAVRQCGAISVGGLDEMIDTLKALLYLPPVTGNRVGVTGVSGGQSVAISDAFGEAGLSVPTLTQESYDELMTFYSLIGGGYRNPIDTANQNGREIRRIIDILDRDANIDNLALLTSAIMGPGVPPGGNVKMLAEVRRDSKKPLIAILVWSYNAGDVEQGGKVMKELQDAGVPTFLSLERGAFALKKAQEYYALKNR
ncbi:MAG: CoA-binding protein [Dehalococcoidales bacterium]|nr:CoA-binding protein [Dehalococcoidales bacterium]